MTIDDVLHKLWTNSTSTFEKYDEKRLWMALQNFIEQNGGTRQRAAYFDVRGGSKPIDQIEPQPQGPIKKLIAKIRPTMG